MRLPFRRRQERPPMKTPDDVMTLTEHLGELRVRIIRSALAITIGAILIVAFYDQVLDFLTKPYIDLCKSKGPEGSVEFCGFDATVSSSNALFIFDPIDGLSTRLRVATYGGLILAMPVVLWQIWRFIVPALHAKEKRYAIPFIGTSIALFLLGGLLAYLTLGKAIEFLISWSGSDVGALFQVSKYIRLVALMVAAFGVGFQFPVLLVFLQLVGVLTPQTLIRSWRYALVIIVVVAAVITPSGDPISLLALAVPMTILYFVSYLVGLLFQRRRRRREAVS
jgi:sec-independent protein translocase protein TatC